MTNRVEAIILLLVLRKRVLWRVVLLSIVMELAAGVVRHTAASYICRKLVAPWGYPCEEHQVTTQDGYILGVQRIPHGIRYYSQTNNLTPVFLQHGVLAAGEHWVLNSPTESLGFILADSGFDVWIGNLRGTQSSQGHVSLSINNKHYWDWSWDEHVIYDLPAMLQLVLDTTGSLAKYIGHSQGTIIFLAGLTQPSLLAKYIDKAVLLAPIAFLIHSTSVLGDAAANLYLDKIFLQFGIDEFNVSNAASKEFIKLYCSLINTNCSNLLQAVSGPNCCLNSSRLPFYADYEPQPTSTKNLAHLAQMVRSGEFQKYDYGLKGNLNHYKQPNPPLYYLSNISPSFDLFLSYGGQDALADLLDVQNLIGEVRGQHANQYLPNYGHLDFTLGTSASTYVYQKVIEFFKSNSTTID